MTREDREPQAVGRVVGKVEFLIAVALLGILRCTLAGESSEGVTDSQRYLQPSQPIMAQEKTAATPRRH